MACRSGAKESCRRRARASRERGGGTSNDKPGPLLRLPAPQTWRRRGARQRFTAAGRQPPAAAGASPRHGQHDGRHRQREDDRAIRVGRRQQPGALRHVARDHGRHTVGQIALDIERAHQAGAFVRLQRQHGAHRAQEGGAETQAGDDGTGQQQGGVAGVGGDQDQQQSGRQRDFTGQQGAEGADPAQRDQGDGEGAAQRQRRHGETAEPGRTGLRGRDDQRRHQRQVEAAQHPYRDIGWRDAEQRLAGLRRHGDAGTQAGPGAAAARRAGTRHSSASASRKSASSSA